MSTKVSTPNPPAPPSSSEQVQAWVDALPQIFEAQLKYAPKELQQQLEMAMRYMPQFSQLQQQIQEQLYPESTGLQENLAQQAREGMAGGMPDWYKQKSQDYFNANLGTNAGSPMGADYFSRGMLEQEKNWGDYYRNLGLSVTGRVPITTPAMGQSSNYMQGYTPGAVGSNMMQGYGSYSNLYGNMYNTNAQMAQANSPMNWLGGIGGMGTALWGAPGAFGGGGILR
jgi:hypothetical protein